MPMVIDALGENVTHLIFCRV